MDNQTCKLLNYPLRMSPAMAPFGALGAILPGHPFDVLYNFDLRHLFGTPALPRYGVRRRFGCSLATIMIVAAAWGFQTGRPMVFGKVVCR